MDTEHTDYFVHCLWDTEVKNIPQTLILLKACLVPGTYLMKINETTMQILPWKDTALQSSKKKNSRSAQLA